jgi:hypothetical protein
MTAADTRRRTPGPELTLVTAPVAPCEGVLVVGMHRSGTSATTRVLNLFGLSLCEEKDLWLSLPGNETGYWESSSLSRFNERLLTAAGGRLVVSAIETGVRRVRRRPRALLPPSRSRMWRRLRVGRA